MEKPEETEAGNSEKIVDEMKEGEVSQVESGLEESQEEIDLDDIPDAQDYKPPVKKVGEDGEEELDDDDIDDVSSGEEEAGFHVQEVTMGNVKLMKLIFDDVEEKRKEYQNQLATHSESEESDEDKENTESNNQDKNTPEIDTTENIKYDDYRELLDENMDQYNSDDDGNFNPMYCGETLSDLEYGDDDERNTESEPEVEEQEDHGKHKKTGEPLVCIRMMEQLELPPDCGISANATTGQESTSQNPMECV